MSGVMSDVNVAVSNGNVSQLCVCVRCAWQITFFQESNERTNEKIKSGNGEFRQKKFWSIKTWRIKKRVKSKGETKTTTRRTASTHRAFLILFYIIVVNFFTVWIYFTLYALPLVTIFSIIKFNRDKKTLSLWNRNSFCLNCEGVFLFLFSEEIHFNNWLRTKASYTIKSCSMQPNFELWLFLEF